MIGGFWGLISPRGVRLGGNEGSFLAVFPTMVDGLLVSGGFDFAGRTGERNFTVLSGDVVLCGTDISEEMTKCNGQASGSGKANNARTVGIYVLRAHATKLIIVYAIRLLLPRPFCSCLQDLG